MSPFHSWLVVIGIFILCYFIALLPKYYFRRKFYARDRNNAVRNNNREFTDILREQDV